MSLRDRIRDILDTLDGIGVDPQLVEAEGSVSGRQEIALSLRTCGDYEAACRGFKASPQPKRAVGRHEFRIRDSLIGDLLLSHHCWPHLDCWEKR